MGELSGVAWYVGIPGSGKTTLATDHLWMLCKVTDRPGVIVDLEGAGQFVTAPPGVQRVSTSAGVETAIAQHKHCLWSPREPREVDDLAEHLSRACVLFDGAHAVLSARAHVSAPLIGCMRGHRHRQLVLLLTTHHLTGDVPQAALSCAPQLYVFRCVSPAVLKTLESEWGLPAGKVSRLPQFEYLGLRPGFS